MEQKEFDELAEKVNSFNAPIDTNKSITDAVIDAQRGSAMSIKEAIDLEATKTALKDESNVGAIVDTKGKELLNDAQAKLVQAETERIKRETDKIRQEREKELADLQKSIDNLRKQAEQISAENSKANQFFESHKSILKCVGIREKLGLRAMQFWLYPASILYALFQLILLPITLCGFTAEQLIAILNTVCERIQSGAIKTIIAVMTVVLIGAIVGVFYYLIGHYVI